ncbi:hypothetical protein AURDEDRAFT_181317 [Auricularia subglabra TFB-10046 SS5]|nr:hypothetical protein AURDEDRAFT_181317 [Auricularia subglabra TFB-10046 SS5]
MSSTSVVQATPSRAGQKRKRADTLIIYGSTDEAGTAAEETDADFAPESPVAGPSTLKPRKHKCSHDGCTKAYTKPSRLEEHLRSHTGEACRSCRPHKCTTCPKAYLRESHLHAHMRTHMDASEKKFVCDVDECGKAFWTAQHLKVHAQVHLGVKPFTCTVADCDAKFAKHHQLRAHVAEAHCPPGTKPFRCEHEGCDKSFSTNQKLTAHAKTHEAKRYVCVQPSCIANGAAPPVFAKWTALQQHMRTAHPPTCPHESCNGRTFASQANLRAHLALHNTRNAEDALHQELDEEDVEDEDEPPRKRRRCDDVVGRDWACPVDGCCKAFKSKKALDNHTKVNHLNRRDFVCAVPSCGRAFGYKHLLQRHVSKVHRASSDDAFSSDADIEPDADPISAIDFITGKHYVQRTEHRRQQGQVLVPCPYPSHFCRGEANETACRFVFSRAYDLRRHLKAEHREEWEKDEVDAWVRRRKKELSVVPTSEAAPATPMVP